MLESTHTAPTNDGMTSSESDDISAQLHRGLQHFRDNNHQEAINCLLPVAEQGQAKAQWLLGVVYASRMSHSGKLLATAIVADAMDGRPSTGDYPEFDAQIRNDHNAANMWLTRAKANGVAFPITEPEKLSATFRKCLAGTMGLSPEECKTYGLANTKTDDASERPRRNNRKASTGLATSKVG